jgi:hypothetical protein
MRHRATDRLVLAIGAILLLAGVAFAAFQS